MLIAHHARQHGVGEDPRRQSRSDGIGEPRGIRHATAKHDHVWIEHVDNRRKRTGEPIVIPLERVQRECVTGEGGIDDVSGSTGCASVGDEITLEAGAREPRLDASVLAAVAQRPR